MLWLIDEFTRECISIRVERKLNYLVVLGELCARHGRREHICAHDGPEFFATAFREWLARLGTKTLNIEPGSPWAAAAQKRLWESLFLPLGFKSFNSKLRDELLALEIFSDLRAAKALIEGWSTPYNTYRTHSSLGYMPPALVIILLAPFMPPQKRGRGT